jgi:hypothetical protein
MYGLLISSQALGIEVRVIVQSQSIFIKLAMFVTVKGKLVFCPTTAYYMSTQVTSRCSSSCGQELIHTSESCQVIGCYGEVSVFGLRMDQRSVGSMQSRAGTTIGSENSRGDGTVLIVICFIIR